MPWVEGPKAIVEGYLAGQAGGGAIADILFGKTNPSGKLAETFALNQEDIASDSWFSGSGRQVQYREGIYVGYRYFDSADKAVLFPFGHGLSYTEFEYSNLFLSSALLSREDSLEVNLEVQNIGDVFGAETVQVYVSALDSEIYRPLSELKGFVKVHLVSQERQRVKVSIDVSSLAVFDTYAKQWVVESGYYLVRVGSSSRDIRLERTVQVQSDDPISSEFLESLRPQLDEGRLLVNDEVFASMLGKNVPDTESSRPFHLNSSLSEVGQTVLGGLVKGQVVKAFKKQMGATSADPIVEKMFEEMANDMPLRSLVLFSRGKLGFKSVRVLLALLNNRFADAVKEALS
jgi:beta-glucosidase